MGLLKKAFAPSCLAFWRNAGLALALMKMIGVPASSGNRLAFSATPNPPPAGMAMSTRRRSGRSLMAVCRPWRGVVTHERLKSQLFHLDGQEHGDFLVVVENEYFRHGVQGFL